MARDIAPSTEFAGHVEAIKSFEARARVQGFLEEVAFEGGEDIASGELLYVMGELLYVIEPAPYEAEIASAEAQLQRRQATPREAEQALARAERLRDRGTVSEAALEEAQAAQRVAAAEVALLPSAVARQGVSVRQQSSSMLMAVNLFSPEGRDDPLFIGHYAILNIRDSQPSRSSAAPVY